MSLTYHEQIQAIVRQYRSSEEEWPTTSRHIAAWAIGQGLWHPQLTLLISKCAEEVSDAMRGEHIVIAKAARCERNTLPASRLMAARPFSGTILGRHLVRIWR